MPDFYERFKAELDTETIMADTPAVVVVGMCLRAAQRAQMALDLLDHDFKPVNGHPDDDECTYRRDGTDDTYCGGSKAQHNDGGDGAP